MTDEQIAEARAVIAAAGLPMMLQINLNDGIVSLTPRGDSNWRFAVLRAVCSEDDDHNAVIDTPRGFAEWMVEAAHPETGWGAALDEIERLTARVKELEHQSNEWQHDCANWADRAVEAQDENARLRPVAEAAATFVTARSAGDMAAFTAASDALREAVQAYREGVRHACVTEREGCGD